LLKHRISQLETDQIMRDQILVENARLRQQLQIEGRYPWRLVGAEVIIRSPDAGRRVITIARGQKDGVQQGMAVIGQTGSEPAALVGIVEAVNTHTSSVLLITDVSCKISARVLYDGTLALGLVQGQWQNGSRLRLEQLDREISLRSGRVVLSAGLTGELLLPLPLTSVPPGIPIGSVERIIESDGLTQFAELRPYIDPDQVRYVWIVLNHDE
jgi:rod shape-determining protein MreC